MKETQEQMQARHKRELEEWEKQFRAENIVTLQTNNYRGEAPYSIEMVFPLGLPPMEASKLCDDLHKRLRIWLKEFDLEQAWLPPKSEVERQQEIERFKRLENDLPQTVMAQLMAIVDDVVGIGSMEEWPAAAHRGFERMHLVLRAVRGEIQQ